MRFRFPTSPCDLQPCPASWSPCSADLCADGCQLRSEHSCVFYKCPQHPTRTPPCAPAASPSSATQPLPPHLVLLFQLLSFAQLVGSSETPLPTQARPAQCCPVQEPRTSWCLYLSSSQCSQNRNRYQVYLWVYNAMHNVPSLAASLFQHLCRALPHIQHSCCRPRCHPPLPRCIFLPLVSPWLCALCNTFLLPHQRPVAIILLCSNLSCYLPHVILAASGFLSFLYLVAVQTWASFRKWETLVVSAQDSLFLLFAWETFPQRH